MGPLSGENRLRILWAKANKILPVHSGGDIRSYNIARYLAAHHELTFFSYYDGERDEEYENALRKQFPHAICVATGKANTSALKRAWDYARRFADEAPYAVNRFASEAVQRQLRCWYEDRSFDVAVCDFLDAAVNFPEKLTIPTVLFQHNVESEIWRRHATNGSGRLMKRVYGFEFRKMSRYEQAAMGRFRHVIAVSDHDRQLMSAWRESAGITVVPTGVDIEQFRGAANARKEKPLVVFVGAMDWEPNVDAVEYFCREIWPRVAASVPHAHFRIVGRNPDARVRKLACESVEVTGRVPSVVDHLQEAAVVVVPLRIGGGTRLKIYEAMAAGKAVVSTTVGAEGLDVHHGKDIVLADSPASFAESVTSLLKDPALRSRYGDAAAELASRYGWPVIAAKFGEVLQAVAGESFVGEQAGARHETLVPPSRVY